MENTSTQLPLSLDCPSSSQTIKLLNFYIPSSLSKVLNQETKKPLCLNSKKEVLKQIAKLQEKLRIIQKIISLDRTVKRI